MKVNSSQIIKVIYAIFSLLLVAGCTVEKHSVAKAPETLEVTFNSDKKHLVVSEPFKVTAHVAYGNKEIKKDTQIEIEIIENGVSVGSVAPKYEGSGNYSLKLMFSSKGHHQVAAHAYYKGFHVMKILSFDVRK